MGFTVYRVQGLRFYRVQGVGFTDKGLGFRVLGDTLASVLRWLAVWACGWWLTAYSLGALTFSVWC